MPDASNYSVKSMVSVNTKNNYKVTGGNVKHALIYVAEIDTACDQSAIKGSQKGYIL